MLLTVRHDGVSQAARVVTRERVPRDTPKLTVDAHTGLNACGQVEIRGADFEHGAQEVSDLHRSVRTRDTQHLINRRDALDELIQPGAPDRVHTAPDRLLLELSR